MIIPNETYYPDIKAFLDDGKVPSQVIRSETIDKDNITVYSNILKQLNAKVGLDLYRIDTMIEFQGAMVVGIDVVNKGRQAFVGLSASYQKQITQHYSKCEV